jgi:hypothetical protein
VLSWIDHGLHIAPDDGDEGVLADLLRAVAVQVTPFLAQRERVAKVEVDQPVGIERRLFVQLARAGLQRAFVFGAAGYTLPEVIASGDAVQQQVLLFAGQRLDGLAHILIVSMRRHHQRRCGRRALRPARL